MKKSICVLLSLVMLFACLGVTSFAEDVYSHSWTVSVDEGSAERIRIVRVAYDENGPKLIQQNGKYTYTPDPYVMTGFLEPVADERVYVVDGDSYYFAILPAGDYRYDQTTGFKALPQNYALKIVTSDDFENDVGIVLNPFQTVSFDVFEDGTPVTDRPATEEDVVYTVKLDVYKLDQVTENTVIKAYNLQNKNLSGIKDFLLNFYRFFLQIINWFFGLGIEIP